MSHYYEMRLAGGLNVPLPEGFAEAAVKAGGGGKVYGWTGQAGGWKSARRLMTACKGSGPLGTTPAWAGYRALLLDQLARDNAPVAFIRVAGKRPPLKAPPAEHEPADDRPAAPKPGHYRVTARPTDPDLVGQVAFPVPTTFAEAVLTRADIASGTEGKTLFYGPDDGETLMRVLESLPGRGWDAYRDTVGYLAGRGDLWVEFTPRAKSFPADAGPPPHEWTPTRKPNSRQPLIVGGAVAGWR